MSSVTRSGGICKELSDKVPIKHPRNFHTNIFRIITDGPSIYLGIYLLFGEGRCRLSCLSPILQSPSSRGNGWMLCINKSTHFANLVFFWHRQMGSFPFLSHFGPPSACLVHKTTQNDDLKWNSFGIYWHCIPTLFGMMYYCTFAWCSKISKIAVRNLTFFGST